MAEGGIYTREEGGKVIGWRGGGHNEICIGADSASDEDYNDTHGCSDWMGLGGGESEIEGEPGVGGGVI